MSPRNRHRLPPLRVLNRSTLRIELAPYDDSSASLDQIVPLIRLLPPRRVTLAPNGTISALVLAEYRLRTQQPPKNIRIAPRTHPRAQRDCVAGTGCCGTVFDSEFAQQCSLQPRVCLEQLSRGRGLPCQAALPRHRNRVRWLGGRGHRARGRYEETWRERHDLRSSSAGKSPAGDGNALTRRTAVRVCSLRATPRQMGGPGVQ